MNKATFAFALMLCGFCLGCGPEATDTSTVPPAPTQEQSTEEIQKAMDSGQIDPAKYGKY
jgi:hypothetical protein